MRYFIYIPVMLLFLVGCRENVIEYSLEDSTANIIIYSRPRAANIFLNNEFTGKMTPDTLKYLEPGTYYLKLSLEGFKDSIIVMNVAPADRESLFIILSQNK